MIIVISRGDPEPPPLFSQLYDYMNEWLNLIPLSLGCDPYEFFHQYAAHLDRKAAANDAALLNNARTKGAGLVAL